MTMDQSRPTDADVVSPSLPEALRAKGYRITPQRQLVLGAVETLRHGTPDEICAEVQRTAVGVNLSTVYRALELLEQLGMVTHTHLGHGAPTYHASTGEDHLHLVCRDCGQVIETDVAVAEAAVNAAIARKGIERAKPVTLLAIVWQSVRTSDNLALTDATLGDDGLLKATLAAPDTESINAALLSIERAGYQITATPRRDQSGTILADLTLRAP